MKKPLALVSVVALFLVGILVGVLGTHMFYHLHLQDPGQASHRAMRRFSEMLEHRLGLTPEQKTEIDLILREARAESDAIRDEIRPKVEEHMAATRERIEAVLTPEQREEFQRMHERHRGRAERFLLGPPGHRPFGKGPPPP